MTITQERRALTTFRRTATPPEDPNCRGSQHTPSHDSWGKGCRCRGAVAAHNEWVAKGYRRIGRRAEPAVAPDGACRAERHGTQQAYVRFGCRCPEAEAAQERRMAYDRSKSGFYVAEARRVRRQTGGRLKNDPRNPWIGATMAVDRNTLTLMLGGFVDRANKGEMIAAIAILGQRGSDRTGLNDTRAIGQRLGLHMRDVTRYRSAMRDLRENRTQRRLAFTKWRAAVTAAGVGRKEQRAAEYAAAVEQAEARRAHYEAVRLERERNRQARTVRRLRESQERAKTVAMAIEKRAGRG